MANDLISRQAAIDAVNEWFGLYAINRTMSNVMSIQDILRQLPSAQPEIIRCKDCKYAHLTYDGDCKHCDKWLDDDDFHLTLYLDGDFYCGYAERRTDEQAVSE